ncbi:MAG: GPW/gp25 family protein [Bacteroidales bacterium]|nr:GPW/gp25 family protein [Bacteroidales bacterium]
MKNGYYTLPLDLNDMFPKQMDERSHDSSTPSLLKKTHSLRKSVDSFIELIITTHLGEYKYDKEFGFEIWDLEFENVQIEKFNTHNYPKQNLEKFLQLKLEKFEPRLKDIKVEILFIHRKNFKGKKIKYFVDITVIGRLANSSSEKYVRSFKFAMGPFFK